MAIRSEPPSLAAESTPVAALGVEDPLARYNHNDSSCAIELAQDYTIGEHLLWAPRRIRVGCIGAGASGIMLCYKKEKEFGNDIDLVVYERHDQPGGVWYTNKYPGCRCDVPSPAYQYSFAPKPDWPMMYSSAQDIQGYYRDFAESRGYLDNYIKLKHSVNKAVWDEDNGQWILSVTERLSSGETRVFEDRVDFLVGNIGVLHTWKWPSIPGRELFKGKMTHSANYDTSLDLKDQRVAVIGSGASAVQIVPAIKDEAAHVVSFYRTPQWISSGMQVEGLTDGSNIAFTDEQKKKFRDDPAYYLECRKKMENNINRAFPVMLKDHPMQTVGRKKVAERMASMINNDPALMKKVMPDFAMGCRRLGLGEEFLHALNTPKVSLADSGIEVFTETGVKCKDGSTIDFDVVICATGFDVSFRPPFALIGREGRVLGDEWGAEPEAYLALAASGYPNFLIGSLGPNCPAGHGSFVTVLESAQNYVCKVIRKLQTENILSLDVKKEVVDEYNQHVHQWLQRTVWAAGCRSWFNGGDPSGKVRAQYPGSLMHWREMMDEPRFEDYNIRYRGTNRFKFMGNGFTKKEVDGQDLSFYLDPDWIKRPLFSH
ncbi:hypothetical protein NW755_013780 [Fusarium falciforme]|uniref:Sterigmatocystin biosynthesis monooxygenase stcW n=1 Tax=Fusarium falciforme TaxID=195108 RepID=A0A9W8QS39_9HYPO|nr:hypothetical protein NW755_013780 [Fusarium falciforme]